MWTWACPRSYYQDADVRRRLKQLIPADLTREEVADAVKAELAAKKLEDQLCFLLVCREPHKRYSPATGTRELHVHVILKMASVFAHQQVAKGLAARGMVGHFSFQACGLNAYLAYCLLPSGGKLATDLDTTPFAWPPTEPDALLKKANEHLAQQQARLGHRVEGSAAPKKQRALLTFSQLTDVVVDNNIQTEEQFWELAKAQKQLGNDALLNTLGKDKSVGNTLTKIRDMWFPGQAVTTLATPGFPLSAFKLPAAVERWAASDCREKTLIIFGDGGSCKTQAALAVLAPLVKRVHLSNKLENLRGKLRPGDGFVYDEACLASLSVDDAKMLCDLDFSRGVHCRNVDFHVPKGVVRVFTTNHSWESFWPAAARTREHEKAIRRRVEWVEVPKGSTLRATSGSNAASTSSGRASSEFLAGAVLSLLTGSPGTRKRALDEIQALASQSQASRPKVSGTPEVASQSQGSGPRVEEAVGVEVREEEEEDPFGHQQLGVCRSGTFICKRCV